MIQQSEKKTPPCKMSLETEKEQDKQRKLEEKNWMKLGLMNLLRESRKILKRRNWLKMIQLMLKQPFSTESNDSSVGKVLDCRHSQVLGAASKVCGRTLYSRIY